MKKEILRNKWYRFWLISFLSFLIAIISFFCNVFDFTESKTYDNRMLLTADTVPSSSDIYFIIIDQESLDWAKQEKGWSWPWPRESYAQMVEFLSAGKVKSIAFDMIYSEPSIYGEKDDLIFARAMENAQNVFQTIFVYTENGKEKVVLPIDSIKNSAAALGNITSCKDDDDIIRRARISYKFNGTEYPALGFLPVWNESFDKSKLPLQKDETVLLRYKKSINDYQPYSMKQILQSYDNWKQGKDSLLVPEDFEDGYVFFALYAPGLFDICSTSVSQVYPGVGVHITSLDNYLNDCFVKKVPTFISLLWFLILALAGSFIVTIAQKIKKQSQHLTFVILSLFIFASFGFFVPYLVFIPGFWLPCVAPLVGFFISFIFTLAFNYSIEGKQRRFIKSAFSQYLSPTVIETLISEPNQLKLGGERREISIYFSDVQGFTTISEKLAETPEKLSEVLNKYLSSMTEIILETGGTIDKYEGDAIIAFWNAPLSQENHAERALTAAIRCQQKLQEIRDELEQMCGKKIYQRIGLNTGFAVVGNMGSQSRFDYTMLGDSVNLASRLEGLNKQFGTYTMCSAATMEQYKKFSNNLKFRKLANVAVVGKSEPVIVYEPFEINEYNQKKEIIENFEQGLEFFANGDFKTAHSIFEKTATTDIPSQIYLEKCNFYIQNPPENWQGVWTAETK